MEMLLHLGRSPPFNLIFGIQIRLEELKMEGNHPKRKRDKYNPYRIYEKDGRAFISFADGQAVNHKFEISKELYEAFNTFELEDIKYLNVLSRHIEHSKVWEDTLNMRALKQPESVEEIVLKKLQNEQLHRAISKLPQKQKSRLILHYFYQLTYVEIAERESCSVRAVEYSVHGAIENLKKFFEKN